MPSSSERRYSAEAALFLAHKWSRPDLVERYLEVFSNSEEEDMRRASVLFEERRRRGLLPAPVDPEHRTAQFLNGFYARHRFSL